jgi:hypothetical protein
MAEQTHGWVDDLDSENLRAGNLAKRTQSRLDNQLPRSLAITLLSFRLAAAAREIYIAS